MKGYANGSGRSAQGCVPTGHLTSRVASRLSKTAHLARVSSSVGRRRWATTTLLAGALAVSTAAPASAAVFEDSQITSRLSCQVGKANVTMPESYYKTILNDGYGDWAVVQSWYLDANGAWQEGPWSVYAYNNDNLMRAGYSGAVWMESGTTKEIASWWTSFRPFTTVAARVWVHSGRDSNWYLADWSRTAFMIPSTGTSCIVKGLYCPTNTYSCTETDRPPSTQVVGGSGPT